MADDTKTIIDKFLEHVDTFGDKTFLTQPMGGGNDNVKTFSYNEVLDEAKKVAGYIESLGYPPKSQIAICSKNCAYWVIADLGIWLAGHVSVPVSSELWWLAQKWTIRTRLTSSFQCIEMICVPIESFGPIHQSIFLTLCLYLNIRFIQPLLQKQLGTFWSIPKPKWFSLESSMRNLGR